MKRLHRIFANGNSQLKGFLDRYGIEHRYEESSVGKTVSLLIAETDPNWCALSRHLEHNPNVLHAAELRFSKKDVLQAKCCRLAVTSHFGYPQPEDGYRSLTYKAESGCGECGVGWVQDAPFRMQNKPTQRRSSVIQLNWIFDEFFFSRQTRKQLEDAGISGVTFDTPVLHSSGEPIPDWSQMHILGVARAVVDDKPLVSERCARCGAQKYNVPGGHMLRMAPPFRNDDLDVVKSKEWFGSGRSAHRLVFVSPRFARLAITCGWRGVELIPCEIMSDTDAA
jgi:hypothetical protein